PTFEIRKISSSAGTHLILPRPADWNVTNPLDPSYIANKPVIKEPLRIMHEEITKDTSGVITRIDLTVTGVYAHRTNIIVGLMDPNTGANIYTSHNASTTDLVLTTNNDLDITTISISSIDTHYDHHTKVAVFVTTDVASNSLNSHVKNVDYYLIVK
ncbi:UNVERIFIED_CONTAM: hypothetical protein RF648_22285, partial [Kocuria sp. CPCC 205274]